MYKNEPGFSGVVAQFVPKPLAASLSTGGVVVSPDATKSVCPQGTYAPSPGQHIFDKKVHFC